MFYLQNCDLWNLFQNSSYKKKTYASYKKIPWIETFFFIFYMYVPNFRALGPVIIFFFKTDLVPLIHVKNTVTQYIIILVLVGRQCVMCSNFFQINVISENLLYKYLQSANKSVNYYEIDIYDMINNRDILSWMVSIYIL